MDTSKPLLSGTAALVVGTIGLIAIAASAFVPTPWGTLVALVGFCCAMLAGFAAKPPAFVAGSPLLQGTALTIAGTAATLLQTFWAAIPAGWPQSLALTAAGLLAWLTGKSMPALGATNAPTPAPSAPAVPVATTTDAAAEFNKAGPNP